MSKHEYTNRLIHQKSPYLLQHAHNPVDWYPWGDEAFQTAKQLDRPIFLSIGYATCHWCHVMESESFEDKELAKEMNKTFINIKVDREELPEVDALYMEFAQSMMKGSAGWPLNVILTPDLEPFFAATYLPPKTQQGLMGMFDLIVRIQQIWAGEEKGRVLEQAGRIVDVFAESVHVAGDEIPEKGKISLTAEFLFKMADPVYGGMKGAPKFPIGYQTDFLLTYSAVYKETRARFLAERTLEMMHRGGIYDHIGGGFSRYSVDEQWLVPHFEKMLYDNAILAHTYLLAWQAMKQPRFEEISRETLNYVLREMTHPEGGFYSAQDADSEGHEGLFYTWTLQELSQFLKEGDVNLISDYFGVTPQGNFEGRNILHISHEIDEFATQRGFAPGELKSRLNALRQQLWSVREKRAHPFLDDKVLSGWNGLMIQSFVLAGRAFGEARYLDAGIKAAEFIRQKLWKDGHLLRRFREGESSFSGGLDEYAFLIRALISLYEAACGMKWLHWALEMTGLLQREFKADRGAFYQSDGKDPSLILRKMHYSDGAEPSGNAVHCENLLRLAQITREEDYLRQAEDVFKAVKPFLDGYPPGYTYHTQNLMRYYDRQAPVFVIALNREQQWKEELLSLLYRHFLPHRTIVWRLQDEEPYPAYLAPMRPIEGQTTLYICKQGVCSAPVYDWNEMQSLFSSLP